jgi:peroxiredoxin
MSLHEKIATLKAQVEKKLPQKTRDVMDRATADLAASGILNGTIKVGDTLPSFTLPNQNGTPVNSNELLKNGPLVISVFRGAWCPYCMLELEALEEVSRHFQEAGANILIISPQTQAASLKTKIEKGLSFDIISDLGSLYTSKLGLVFSLPEDLRKIYKGIGIDLPSFNGDESWELPMPARLIISQAGEVINADINPDYTKRPEPADTLQELLVSARQDLTNA